MFIELGDDQLPLIGFGTYPLEGQAAIDAVGSALDSGYRLIDSAVKYANEASVGEAIRRSGVDRSSLMITTKVFGGDHGSVATRSGLLGSLRRFGVDYLDILLIHWPNPSRGLAVETWETMIELKKEGLVRHIGVSNFLPEQLTELHEATGVWPEINQIQCNVGLPKTEARAFHDTHGIITQAWGPLGERTSLTDNEIMAEVAGRHNVTEHQVALRWLVQQEIVAIPKSATPERQVKNMDVFAFDLTDQDFADLASLEAPEDPKWDPRTHEEW